MNFCIKCGASVSMIVPDGDTRERAVCDNCGHIHYVNPRIVTGCLPVHEDQVLLCRRAIEPRYGFWTLPAGYLENGETVAAGAGQTPHPTRARSQDDSSYANTLKLNVNIYAYVLFVLIPSVGWDPWIGSH